MEVSELPRSTGEHASSVEPVREIAMAERLVVTSPRRVKDDIVGVRFWLEIEDVRTCRGPSNGRGIERGVLPRPAGVVVAILVHHESSVSRGGGCRRGDGGGQSENRNKPQAQSLSMLGRFRLPC